MYIVGKYIISLYELILSTNKGGQINSRSYLVMDLKKTFLVPDSCSSTEREGYSIKAVRAHITNGKPNFCLYCWLRWFIFCLSCSVRFWRPALLCSLVDSAVKLPDAASRPARSGWSRKIPSFPGIVKKQNYVIWLLLQHI
jgi:hypothetical protein